MQIKQIKWSCVYESYGILFYILKVEIFLIFYNLKDYVGYYYKQGKILFVSVIVIDNK